ncbi:Na+/solute symporter [Tilletiaria anomala UBC 951]|uniref:Na+/solute symporter n=1 Tax=Tilletiaria anomala (strain ATCC 24038 / CBS 436.72 / UBC 951) TaxID=1037660 RepID=A0A066VGU1_TILAU|nr:Na+/solute symporter [Tilletiaria anomala UBC 951]KDN40706.1 Na+/solute symporter [Tilletiaria anomala UBC 951]
MVSSSAQVLSPSAGWAVVIALGFGFALFMLGLTAVQERYTEVSIKTNDEFSSASRSVKTGLIAAGIVSAWTWAATLLQSSTVAFRYGVSGPFWYAAGATVQVLLFAMMASKTKSNAPFAHTYLQIIRERWGTVAHLSFLFFGLATNILVGSMLILGASATVNQLTGMPTLAAIFLTPVSVAVYALVGGMRSTLIADWTHTAVLVCIILTFAFTVYGTSGKIGSPRAMHDLLLSAAPVSGNAAGSYITMRSLDGLKFGIINICGNFATVFADQSYHQRGIASNPTTATRAFILGGVAWFAVPMVTASSLGLAARALYGKDPDMADLSASEVSAGLAAPAAAAALLGKSGAAAMLVMLYLAVTSATSAQLIAVSSVFTFDVWKPYIQPSASEKQLFWVSHVAVAAWSVALGVLGLIFYEINLSMGWLYTFMGIIIAPAVFPIFSCIVWSKANRTGALVGMFSGLALGIIAWLVSASLLEGSLTVDTTGADNPLVVGNVVSIMVPAIVTIVWSLITPDNYSFEGTRAINTEVSDSTTTSPPADSAMEEGCKEAVDETPATLEKATVKLNEIDPHKHVRSAGLDHEQLQKSFRTAVMVTVPLTFTLLIFVPCMSIIAKTFSPAGLGAWIGICIFWLFCSAFIVIVLPIWESRQAMGQICSGIISDLNGRSRSFSSS